MTIKKALGYGQKYLQNYSPSPSLDSLVLLGFAGKMSKEFIYAHSEVELPGNTVTQYQRLLIKRKKHWPIAYLINSMEFYGNNLYINNKVLIPSADSEILVDLALKNLPAINVYKKQISIWDIGTGSGCLIISILETAKLPVRAVASDISPWALEVAQINANKILGPAGRKNLKLIRQDIFSGKALRRPSGGFDLIICNPPYIPSAEIPGLQKEVAYFEPKAALDGGADGLKFYRKLREIILHYLAPEGSAFLEMNSDLAEEIKLVFSGLNSEIYPDLEGRPRVIKIKKT